MLLLLWITQVTKKQLSERTLRAFCRSQEQKEQVATTNNATIEEGQVNDRTYSLQDSPEKDVEAMNTKKLVNTSRTERDASINAAFNIK